MAGGGQGTLRRRLIAEDDVPRLLSVLARAFPDRNEASWRRGLERLGRRQPPAGLPRYGILLEAGGRIVGAVLTISAEVEGAGRPVPRCHLSSWFVDPAHAAHAALLIGPLLRRSDVTLVNVTPAAHTEATIERQGFRPFCRGSLLVLPLVAKPTTWRGRVRALDPGDAATEVERALIADHLAWGCRGLAVERNGTTLPFLFAQPRRLRGVLPMIRLLYCRDLAAFAEHAGALGRALLRAGIAAVVIDTAASIPGLPCRRIGGTQGRYWRGPHPPRPGDLAYGEEALFGSEAMSQRRGGRGRPAR